MINETDHYVAWALLWHELDDGREHLEDLLKSMDESGRIDDAEFEVRLGHVYAHLNRAWQARALTREMTSDEHSQFSAFPEDLTPVG